MNLNICSTHAHKNLPPLVQIGTWPETYDFGKTHHKQRENNPPLIVYSNRTVQLVGILDTTCSFFHTRMVIFVIHIWKIHIRA